jgi:uncharacterized phage protein (TIGR02220 family)
MSENFGQIPDKVRYNNELTFFARLIYTDILSLAKKENFCFATNQYFADLYNVSQKTVSISIKELEKEFCISVELTKDSRGTYRKITPLHFVCITKTSNGMEENVKRGITKTSNGYNEKVKPVLQKLPTGVEENVKPKEYINNNIEINIENNKEKSDFSFSESSQDLTSLNDKKELEKVNRANFVNDKESEPAESAKYFFEVTQVLELLTERTGVKFVIPKTRAGIEKYEPYKLIKERLNDKATLEDIFAVVEMKNKEWFGTKVYVYMKPSTLFRKSNFDSYLQQLQISVNIKQQSKQQVYPEPEFKIFTGEGIDLTKDPSYMPELGW